MSPPFKHPRKALSSKQERRLVSYLDECFLDITRNFKKRTEPSSKLQTLGEFLEAYRRLLALILQIPPIDPSTGLRIAYLLHLTGEVLCSLPGYQLNTPESPLNSSLQDLLDFLDDLDQAWLAVLRGQVWDPDTAEGVTLEFPIDLDLTESEGEESPWKPFKSSPPSQTDLTRLRSLLLSGESTIEEWLTQERKPKGASSKDEVEDVSLSLARLGLLDRFDSLFVRTLDHLGGFSGEVAHNYVDPDTEVTMEECFMYDIELNT